MPIDLYAHFRQIDIHTNGRGGGYNRSLSPDMGAVENRFLGLRPFEILVFIIALILLGLCLAVVPSVSSSAEESLREDLGVKNTTDVGQ
jgi:hypothetical protein